jgi:hypothetical protein
LAHHGDGRARTSLGGLGVALVALELFLGVGAVASGIGLIADPTGGLGMSTSVLADSPFSDFLVPGIILFLAVGVFPLVVAVSALRGAGWVGLGHIAVGAVVLGWIVGEFVLLGYISWLQPAILVLGLAILMLALLNRRARAAR